MKRSGQYLILCIMLLLINGSVSYGQSSQIEQLSGKWIGALDAMGMKKHVSVSFTMENGTLKGNADSPDDGVYNIPIDSITVDGNKLVLILNAAPGVYNGKINFAENIIKGEWSQNGNVLPLDLKKEIVEEKKAETQYTSYWEGKLKVGGMNLPLIVKIYKNADGTSAGHLDSPAQNVKNMPAEKVRLTADSLILSVKAIGGSYSGMLIKDSAIVKGVWKQGSVSLPLNLKKVDKLTELKRPQTPKRPFPYNEEDVVFENPLANIKLAGTFTYPKEGKQFPAVILVTGSGRQDRDENVFDHKIFLVISDYLTRNGIAVLRYDDRGVAKSGGNYSAATSADFATDALAAIEYLKSRKEVFPNKVGIIGHSEGGLIAPMVASQSDEVDFIVMLAGPGIRGDKIIIEQTGLISKAEGKSDAEVNREVDETAKNIDIVVNEPDSAKAYEQLKKLFDEKTSKLSDEERKRPENSENMFKSQARTLLSPWFRYFLKYDPRPALEKVKIPVLALNGEKDIQVPAEENLKAVESALKAGGNKNFKIVEVPGLNHVFQHCKTCAESEYIQLEETFAPEVMKIMSDWILEVTK